MEGRSGHEMDGWMNQQKEGGERGRRGDNRTGGRTNLGRRGGRRRRRGRGRRRPLFPAAHAVDGALLSSRKR
jgi:hypothetical protein